MKYDFKLKEFEKEFYNRRKNWLNKYFADKELFEATDKAIRKASICLLKSRCQFIFLDDFYRNLKNNKDFYDSLDSDNKKFISQMGKFISNINEDIGDILESIFILFENNE